MNERMCWPEDMLESNAVGSLAFAVGWPIAFTLLFSNPLLLVFDDLSPGGIFSNDLSAITLSGFEIGEGGIDSDLLLYLRRPDGRR